MKLFKSTLTATLLVLGMSSASAFAAQVDLFQPAVTTTFGMGNSETRETYVEVLNTVEISDFSAILDITNAQGTNLNWTIYNSDASSTFGSVVASTSTFEAADAVALKTFNSGLSATLTQGFYIFQMQAQSSGVMMERFNEANQTLPFVTADNNFRVIDGGANNFFGNTILPAFSVNTDVAPVPLPAGLPLLLGGMAAFGALRRSKRRS